jgi:hypothetical protein
MVLLLQLFDLFDQLSNSFLIVIAGAGVLGRT